MAIENIMRSLPEDAKVPEVDDNLPEHFFSIPDTFISDSRVKEIYYSTYQQLLEENDSRDTIETMMIERAAALYAYMRSLELEEGYSNSSDYRQLMKVWNDMANDLRKTRHINVDESQIREEMVSDILSDIQEAMRGFSPEISSTVYRTLYNKFTSGE